ncbi:MAG: SynChlorMet cassette protein ScmC [Deltaproteobacteria bacterium RBG_13_52_11]|nr:MAG: SynChlorMet cassette protein ScmC [Deltaproteobacteria bacterium RBG_13_52_11]
MVASLLLADGSTWGIVAGDERAVGICSRLAEVMQLRSQDTPVYRLLVLRDGNGACANPTHADRRRQVPVPWTFLPPKEGNTFTLICSPAGDNDMLANHLMQLSLVIAQQVQTRGGFLLHGALAANGGGGVILAGPGGVGKTTASCRLRSPWRSLSDDATLVVRDENGTYWAHPWPTWSNFMLDGKGGTWDVEHAVPLKAIFFLVQAQHDRIEPIGAGHSVPLLVELAEQASWSMAHGQGGDVARALRLQRFENICSLARSMSCYHLHLRLDGAFWEEIERVLAGEEMGVS